MDISAVAIEAGRLSRRARAWLVRLALVFVAGLAFVVGSSEEAHAISDAERFPVSPNFCVGERSLTYAWAPNGGLYGQSVTRPYSGDCLTPLSAPEGHLAGRVITYKWSYYYGYWYECRDTGWDYNENRTSKLVVYKWLGGFFNRFCGPGYYATMSQGSVWYGDAWRTTPRVWSGSAYYY